MKKKTSLIAALVLSATTVVGLASCGDTTSSSSDSGINSSATTALPRVILTNYEGKAPKRALVNQRVDLDEFIAVRMSDNSLSKDYRIAVAAADVVVEGHKVAATRAGNFDIRVFVGGDDFETAALKAIVSLKFVDELQAEVIDFLQPLSTNPKNITIDLYKASGDNLIYDGATIVHHEDYSAFYNKENPGELDDKGNPNSFIVVRNLTDNKAHTGAFGSDGKPVFDVGDVTATYPYYYITGNVSLDGDSLQYQRLSEEDTEDTLTGDALFTTNLLSYGCSFPVENQGYTSAYTHIIGFDEDEGGKKTLFVIPYMTDKDGKLVFYSILGIHDLGTSKVDIIETAMKDESYVPVSIVGPEIVTTANDIVAAGNYTVEFNAYAADSAGKKLTPTQETAATFAYCHLFGVLGEIKMTSYVTADGIYAKTTVGEKTLDERAFFNKDGQAHQGLLGKDDSFAITPIADVTDAKTTAMFKAATLGTVAEADVNGINWMHKTTDGTKTTFDGKVGDNDGATDGVVLYRNLLKLAAFPVNDLVKGGTTTLSEMLTKTVDFNAGAKHSLCVYDEYQSFVVDTAAKTLEVSVLGMLPIGAANAYYHMDFKVTSVGTTAFDFSTLAARP